MEANAVRGIGHHHSRPTHPLFTLTIRYYGPVANPELIATHKLPSAIVPAQQHLLHTHTHTHTRVPKYYYPSHRVHARVGGAPGGRDLRGIAQRSGGQCGKTFRAAETRGRLSDG